MATLNLTLLDDMRRVHQSVELTCGIVAGWAGRDHDAVMRHIAELAGLGVKPPSTTPIFYRVSMARFTTASEIEVTGETSSGEVEIVMLRHDNRTWVGVGSDHTDRSVESYNVTVSKQMCDKPIAPEFWSYDAVLTHWDDLILRSYISENGKRVLYQEGSVASLLAPSDLIAKLNNGGSFPEGCLMLCGTLGAKGGIRPSRRFEIELEDPVMRRRISHKYEINYLPVVG